MKHEMTASECEGSYGALLNSFISSVKADLDSPVTSNFGNRIAEYRAEVCCPVFYEFLSISMRCDVVWRTKQNPCFCLHFY